MPQGLVLACQPILPGQPASLTLQDGASQLVSVALPRNQAISLHLDTAQRWCTGWYDIASHTVHPCPQARRVDPKGDCCFDCRQRTGFNPAFYNTDQISTVQETYNRQPHSVYVAYFGHGLAKAGIMSDSRGLTRLYEQGALLYALMGSFPDAYLAHELEAQLISQGLKNSIAKRQKEAVWRTPVILDHETLQFQTLLDTLEVNLAGPIVSNLDDFFYGEYPQQPIAQFREGQAYSGTISGMIGHYLVLSNQGQLFGCWLSTFTGYHVTVSDAIIPVTTPPRQTSLF